MYYLKTIIADKKINMKKILLMTVILLQLAACKKKNEYPTYTGEVKGHSNDCTGTTGFPIVIKVYDSNQYDTVYTLTLPNQYWIVGKKISFKLRPLQSNDEPMLCNAMIIAPKQVVVFDVSNQ